MDDPPGNLAHVKSSEFDMFLQEIEDNEQMDVGEKEESDKETIKKVYDKYVETYNRKPRFPDHFRHFALNFHDVYITFGTAKSFINEMNSISNEPSTSPPMLNIPSKLKMSSASTPLLFQTNAEKSKYRSKIKPKLNKKYENKNESQLLKLIKSEIINLDSIKNNTEILTELDDKIWNNMDGEYNELINRLQRNSSSNKRRTYHHQPSMSKDETFLSLKKWSQATDVDDVDHDSAVFLLRTYYGDNNNPNDNDNDGDDYDDASTTTSGYTLTSQSEEALNLYDSMILKYRKTAEDDDDIDDDMNDMNDINVASPMISQRSAPTKSSNTDSPKKVSFKYPKRFSLTSNQMIKPRLSGFNEVPLLDKAFRMLSTRTIDSMIIDNVHNMDEKEKDDNNNNNNKIHDIPLNLSDIMTKYGDQMDLWDFDIFGFMDDSLLAGKGLVYLGFFLFRKCGFFEITGVSQSHFWRFLENVQMGYLNNPYHNKYHAVDVLLNTHYMFEGEGGSPFLNNHMTVWDRFGAYIAALCHDLGHMGFNNVWYINTAGNLALLYGDESVLENYHLTETFRILNKPGCNWMLSFTSSIRKYLAVIIRHCILATDVKNHGIKVVQLQNMINIFNKIGNDFNIIPLQKCKSIEMYSNLDMIKQDGFKLFIDDKKEKEFIKDIIINDIDGDNDEKEEEQVFKPRIDGVMDERLFILGVLIHCSDVANPCKPLTLCIKWAKMYLQEAWSQGDNERLIGIPVSSGMDRFTTKLENSQIGFIAYIVKRIFILFEKLLKSKNIQICLQTMLENEKHWIQEKKKKTYKGKLAKKPTLVTIDESKNTNQ